MGINIFGHNRLLSKSGEALQAALSENKDTNAWNQYPRPQMRRESFLSLNGYWRLNGQEILVPFPPQSLLSGFQGHIGSCLEYSRAFILSRNEEKLLWNVRNSRILLHFGAVDQVAEVFVNGHYAGKHEGGYLPFCFDITEYVQEGENRLLVKARDTLSARYPYGKQRKNRGGMWYTPVSGIWQSVWLEAVPGFYVEKLNITADMRKVNLTVTCKDACLGDACSGSENFGPENCNPENSAARLPAIAATIKLHNGKLYPVPRENIILQCSCSVPSFEETVPVVKFGIQADLAAIRLADGSFYRPQLWTPENPYLYEITVSLGEDTVTSYFGLRTVEIRETDGLPRVCLNGEPVFLHGVLDQGYFCDGIYLPGEEAEYREDIQRMQELGMNLLRKHIKIEPECFYHYCDTHGMLVMQDMVNSGVYSWIKDTALPTLGIFSKGNGKLWSRKRRREFFIGHMKDTIEHLRNHPSVIAYTIFNEGWGQFDSDAMYDLAMGLDNTRLYDTTSGWFSREKSHFDSQHIYFRKLNLPRHPEKPVLVSECGGYSLKIQKHIYAKYSSYGYGKCADERELTERIRELYETIILPAIPAGLCGCIYTQLSDVEDETNGLYTYDRKVCKVPKDVMQDIAQKLFRKISGHSDIKL